MKVKPKAMTNNTFFDDFLLQDNEIELNDLGFQH